MTNQPEDVDQKRIIEDLRRENAALRARLDELSTTRLGELNDSALRFGTLIQAMPDIVCFKDGHGRWLIANDFDVDLFQLEGVDYRGRTDAELAAHTPFYRDALMGCMDSDEMAWAKRVPSRADEVIPRPDGTEKVFDVIKVPIFHEDGSRRGLLVLGRDITERRQLEVELRQVARLDAVGRLAGGVAHDFNNVLTAVLGHAALLELDLPEGSSHHSSAKSVREAAERATMLTKQLLGLSRRGLGESGPVSVHAVVTEVEGLLHSTMGKGIELTVDVGGFEPVVVGDGGQLHQVLTNLAINARDAMGGRGRLTIRTRRLDEPPAWTGLREHVEGYVLIAVDDTGPGIEPALRDRVFEPFFSTKGREGTGMGLAVARGIATDHGGAVRATTAPGGGARMEVVLPLGRSEAKAAAKVHRAVPPLESSIRVLIVDDDPMARHAEEVLLAHLGCRVESCEDGLSALRRLAVELPDLVVLDVDMPGLNGLEVLARIRQLDRDLPVLLVTGLGGCEVEAQARALGVVEVLGKPLALASLRDAAARAVGG